MTIDKTTFEKQINDFIEILGIQPCRVLVALSGGADSVALLNILISLGYQCIAAHCNFKLRGAESDRDESFVVQLCESKGVALHRMIFNVEDYKKLHGCSTEMACRELRYDWFKTLKEACDCQYIAVAHHLDDNIETMFLNMFRGTGIKGMCAMKPLAGYILRPLLCTDRNSILEYLQAIGQSFVTDSTNLGIDYARNKIRNSILPVIYQSFPSAKHGFLKTINNLTGDFLVWKDSIDRFSSLAIKKDSESLRINRQLLATTPNATSVLHTLISEYGFSQNQIEQMVTTDRVGAIFESKRNYIAEIGRNDIVLFENKSDNQEIIFHIGQNMPKILTYEILDKTINIAFQKDNNVAYFDAEILNKTLVLRHYRQGDYFRPFGMNGKQKVSDFFNNNKYSLLEKRNQLFLEIDGKIVWVLGCRTTREFPISDKTKKIVVLRYDSKVVC